MSGGAGAVVVGGSIGGVRTVQALRRDGYRGRIRLLSDESVPPYDKPPLSKQYLAGTKTLEDFTLLSPAAAKDLGVELLLDSRAVALDLESSSVALQDGSRLDYDDLVIATGSRPRPTGWDHIDGVFDVRTLADADGLRLAFERSASAAVVGAGFIGAEVAATARSLGLAVTMIDPLPYPMARVLGGSLADRFVALHKGYGVDLRLQTSVKSVRPASGAVELTLSDGSTIIRDTVVVGIGTQPNVEWLAPAGLGIDNGVICDSRGRAKGGSRVYAVGDVSRWHDPRHDAHHRHEHWTNAVEQAAIVARMIATGDAPEHSSVGYVWSDQYDWHIQVVGDPGAGELVEVIDAPPIVTDVTSRPRFAAIFKDEDGRFVGGVAVCWPKAMVTLRRAMATSGDAVAVAASLDELATHKPVRR